MRHVFTIATVLGLALGVYFLIPTKQSSVGVHVAAQPRVAEHAGLSEQVAEMEKAGAPSADAPATSVAVVWRSRPPALRWKDYSDKTYDELRRLAEAGDGYAAAYLASRLSKCRHLPPPQTSAEIDAAIEEMRRTHKVPTYWGGHPTVVDFNNSLDSLEPNIETYVRLARKCSAVATKQRAEWKDWADRALALGITDMLLHGTLRDRMESEQYEQLMHDFWEAGEPTALFTLANIYRRAANVASDPFGHIRAYAHDAAVLALMRDHYESTGVGLDEAGLAGFEDHLAMQRQHMHVHEIDEAEQLAMDIIEKNDNCCLAWPGYLTDF